MADLKNGTSSYPTSVDSATLVADGVDTPSQGHFNGPATAVVNIETELGIGLKGALADLATRLNINMSTAGGFLYGAAFPVAPANTPHMFWRTDLNKLYHYDISLASYSEVATSVSLADYVSKTTGATISAVYQFNPTVAGAPFTLGANGQNQRVTGLAADKLYDGTALRSASPTAAANTIPVSNASGVIDFQAKHLAMTGEASATNASNPTLNMGTVTSGDSIFVSAACTINRTVGSGISGAAVWANKNTGTSTGNFLGGYAYLRNSHVGTDGLGSGSIVGVPSVSGVWMVTGNGTLTLEGWGQAYSNCSVTDVRLYAVFLKKQ